MINIKEIQIVLRRMAQLIREGGRIDWSIALEKFADEIAGDPGFVSAKILSTFGGIGSLNDIVLYKGRQPLSKENVELDDLRSRLYNLCHD